MEQGIVKFNGENKIIVAYCAKKIGNYSRSELILEVSRLINYILSALGWSKSMEEVDGISVMTADKLIETHKHHSLEEFRIACDKGMVGEFGEYQGLGMVILIKWFNLYLKSLERINAMKTYISNQKESFGAPKLSNEEIEVRMQMALKRNKEYLKEDKFEWFRFDTGNAVYDWLDEKKLIKLSLEEKELIFSEAKKMLLAEAEKDKKEMRFSFYEYGKLIRNLEEKKAGSVIVRAKKIALKKYLEINK